MSRSCTHESHSACCATRAMATWPGGASAGVDQAPSTRSIAPASASFVSTSCSRVCCGLVGPDGGDHLGRRGDRIERGEEARRFAPQAGVDRERPELGGGDEVCHHVLDRPSLAPTRCGPLPVVERGEGRRQPTALTQQRRSRIRDQPLRPNHRPLPIHRRQLHHRDRSRAAHRAGREHPRGERRQRRDEPLEGAKARSARETGVGPRRPSHETKSNRGRRVAPMMLAAGGCSSRRR